MQDSGTHAGAATTLDSILLAMLEDSPAEPDAIAMVEGTTGWRRHLRGQPRRIRHRQVHERIRKVASGLRRRGMAEGDVALFAVRTGIDAFVLMSALQLAGAVVVGLDPGIGKRLFEDRMRLLKPKWVIAESIIYAASAPGPLRWWLRRRGIHLPEIQRLDARFVRVGPWLPGIPDSMAYLRLCREPAEAIPASRPDPDRDVLAFFTSGTTAKPRLVVHSATSLGSACACVNSLMALRREDVVYSTQTHQILAALSAGGRCIVPPVSVDPARFISDIKVHGVTHVYAVPFEMVAAVDELERRGRRFPASLGTIVLGSAPVDRRLLSRLRKVCAPGTVVWCVYAMSEMFPVALVEAEEKLAYTGEGDLVGHPIEGACVAVADDGELLVSGPNLFSRYQGRQPVVPHPTGDLARIDDAGRIILLGRKKDMVIRGHHNLYPSLYEETIAGIPGIVACAMVGIPNAEGTDEHLVLAIEASPGETQSRLRERLERSLRSGPSAIDAFAFPDEILFTRIPRAGRSHKIDRKALARLATRHFLPQARKDA